MKHDQVKKVIADAQKQLDKVRRCLKAVQQSLDHGAAETLPAVEAAVSAVQALDLEVSLRDLEGLRGELQRQVDAHLEERREKIFHAAKSSGWAVSRLQNEDRIGCFKLAYRRLQISVTLGSEPLCKFAEVDGEKAFARLKELRSELEKFPFDREKFFQSIKDGLRIAELKGIRADNEGHVFVRDLYPMIVLARLVREPSFVKLPTAAKITDYPFVQFLFDFARFGEEGWSTSAGQRLSAPIPNSEQVVRGQTVFLPQLKGEGKPNQVGRLGIKRQ